MTYGFKVVERKDHGLSEYMDDKGNDVVDHWSGRAVPNVTDWKPAEPELCSQGKIDQDLVQSRAGDFCSLRRHVAPAIAMSEDRTFSVIDDECVAATCASMFCARRRICISMVELASGHTDPRYRKNRSKRRMQLGRRTRTSPPPRRRVNLGPRRYFAVRRG